MSTKRQPVWVEQEVFDGLESVRRSGLTNMLDMPRVMAIASVRGYYRTVLWIEENPELYAQGIFRGFDVPEPVPEGE